MTFALAPMACLTHFAFRSVVARFAHPHLYYSEMIHSPSLLAGGKFERYYMLTTKEEPLIWQLTSNETDTIKESIAILLEYGGCGIDLNMGCTAPNILKTGAGFAWLKKDCQETILWLRNAKDAIDAFSKKKGGEKRVLSVKMRLPSSDYKELFRLASIFRDCGVDRITLHPRLEKEKYSRPPHYEYVGRLAKELSIPIFCNGDIKSYKDIERLSHLFPDIAGWMIGREAVKRPWIFKELIKHSTGESTYEDDRVDLLATSRLFLQNLLKWQPEEFQLLRAKRFFAFFCDNFKFSHFIKTKILNATSLVKIEELVVSYLEEVPSDKFKVF